MPKCDLCQVEYKDGEEHKCVPSKNEGVTQTTNPQQA